MITPTPGGRPRQQGQVIVIVALAMTAMLAMVALVIDGGNAYAQQRRTQNGIDAIAEAGATQLARLLVGVPIGDLEVKTAVDLTAAANDISTVESAEYTDLAGTPLGAVGTGVIPPGTQGVKVGGNREFNTYVGGIVGMSKWKASAEATAVTGFAEDSGFGGLIPLTFPILLTQCQSAADPARSSSRMTGSSIHPTTRPSGRRGRSARTTGSPSRSAPMDPATSAGSIGIVAAAGWLS